ncbi:hypothetical protein V6N13_042932 [Hibiscus sabdariffa]
MGGKLFLLSIEDDDLYIMLEDVNWSYLMETFEEVSPWSENFKHIERTTWLEATGIPLHYWNYETFQRLSQLWGTLEVVGENLSMSKDCEKIMILITTDNVKEIGERVEMAVEDMVYTIRVKELGLSNNSTCVLKKMPKENGEGEHDVSLDDTASSSNSS